jgi:hypothetical protein
MNRRLTVNWYILVFFLYAIFNTPYMLLGKRIVNHQYTCFICFIFCFNHDLKMSLTYLSLKIQCSFITSSRYLIHNKISISGRSILCVAYVESYAVIRKCSRIIYLRPYMDLWRNNSEINLIKSSTTLKPCNFLTSIPEIRLEIRINSVRESPEADSVFVPSFSSKYKFTYYSINMRKRGLKTFPFFPGTRNF